MERPYQSIEEQMDAEYELDCEGREARNLPWLCRAEFDIVWAARQAALPPAEPLDTDDDLPF